MPRDDRTGAAVVVPGGYSALQEQDCVQRTRPDPRAFLNIETPEQAAEWEAMKAEGRAKAAALLQQVHAAGEPLTVPRWKLSGNWIPALADTHVPMLRDRSIPYFTVYADDRVAPADAPEVSPW